MKATAFLTIATASSLLAPSVAMAAPVKTSAAATAEISDFLNEVFTFSLPDISAGRAVLATTHVQIVIKDRTNR
jgi:hypothetical protein